MRARIPAAAGAPVRAEDALFLYAQGPLLCQQIGAVLLLEPAIVEIGPLRAAIRQRVGAVPALSFPEHGSRLPSTTRAA